jgi:hypothetical protein
MCSSVGNGRPAAPRDSSNVQSTLILGNSAYFGGSIAALKPAGGGNDEPRGSGGACSIVDGSILPWDPKANGHIWGMATDGHKIFIGGEFSSVGGQPRSGLAAVDPVTGAVDSWAPSLSGGTVRTLLAHGDTLYVGGLFDHVDGQLRDGAAAFDIGSGSLRPWAPHLIRGTDVQNLIVPIEVRAFAVWHDKVILAGHFSEEGLADDTGHLAAFDIATAAPLPWEFKPGFPVFGLTATEHGVFAGGAGHGPSENSVTRIDPVTGAMGWQIFTDGNVQTYVGNADRLYIGGHFVHITEAGNHHAGAPVLADRNRLMVVRTTDGALMDWDPGMDTSAEGVWSISSDPGQHVLVAGGEFHSVAGKAQPGIARWILPYPYLSTVSPASAPQGASNQGVMLEGSNLDSSGTLDFGPGVTAVGTGGTSDAAGVKVTVAPSAAVGLRDVKVTRPDGQITTCLGCFEVLASGTAPNLGAGGTPGGSGGNTTPIDPGPGGYRLVASDGGIFSFGDATFQGSTGDIKLAQPIVGLAGTSSGKGYWLVASDGGIFAFGDATFFGSTGDIRLARPIVGMTSTPTGKGYWLVASDGGIFAFGDARFFGSTGDIRLARPIVGMTSTPTGKGYRLVASDGGIFSFGDATFQGSTGNIRLVKPIVTMTSTASGMGYRLVASDGGIFAFGDATFLGSTGNLHLARSIIGMATTRTGNGYWMVASDGGIFAFGDAPFKGSVGSTKLAKPVIGIAGA